MVEIGKINRLTIIRQLDYGTQLNDSESEIVLLAKKDSPPNCRPGDKLEVFVYEDREKHLLATTRMPYATVGQFAKLRVVANSSSGAYLDWGMQKDLLVPKSEQQARMEIGKSYIVFVFLDKKTNRITASTKLDKFFSPHPPDYQEGEEVRLIIFTKTDLGYKAIINHSHQGIVYKNEIFQTLHIGQRLKGYVKKIREDQKTDLTLQPSGYQRVDDVSQDILKTIKDLGGRIAVTDKSRPEEIYSLFGVSKKTFKRAIGALYKRRLVTLEKDGIKLRAVK
ncbi:MAG TPA: GntR family transcriptional regulator [Desulfobacterales bacterium]|nr:GntR family transcriptional regulator [Desulfobacterales bacterium]